MLKPSTKTDQKGFTIIEVLIVLAIAGLILLIVFLAVPALQRNSRNTARKNDVARLGGAATEFVSNNSGTLPVAGDVGAVTNSAGKLGQYDVANVTIGAPQTVQSVEKIHIATKSKCSTAGAAVSGTSRQMAIQYAVETGGGTGYTSVCTDI